VYLFLERTGEMRAIELEELPKEIPIAKRSVSAEAPLTASPISNVNVGIMYHKWRVDSASQCVQNKVER
jgi:hypothetical protein